MFSDAMRAIKEDGRRLFGELFLYREHVPLRNFSTVKCGGEAAVLFFPRREDILMFLVSAAKQASIPLVFVGKGSNTLFLSGEHKKMFISTAAFTRMTLLNGILTAEAGVSLPFLCRFSAECSLSGCERLYGIPASVGGAVAMNAGAYGAEIADRLVSSDVLIPTEDGGVAIRTLSAPEHCFSYRRSIFHEKQEWCILRSRFSFFKGSRQEIQEDMRTVSEKRRASQPVELPSLGSVFKRPAVGYAAKYIENAGLKGFRIGGCKVSEKHAGFIVNDRCATPEEILRLADEIERRVEQAFGVCLQKEIKIVR